MICTKGVHQRAKFQTFDGSRKILPNLYFDRLLKVLKFQLRSTEELYLMNLKIDAKFEKKTLICRFKTDKNFGEI